MQKPIQIEIGKRRWQLDLWQLIFLVDSVKEELGIGTELSPSLQEEIENGGAY